MCFGPFARRRCPKALRHRSNFLSLRSSCRTTETPLTTLSSTKKTNNISTSSSTYSGLRRSRHTNCSWRSPESLTNSNYYSSWNNNPIGTRCIRHWLTKKSTNHSSIIFRSLRHSVQESHFRHRQNQNSKILLNYSRLQ